MKQHALPVVIGNWIFLTYMLYISLMIIHKMHQLQSQHITIHQSDKYKKEKHKKGYNNWHNNLVFVHKKNSRRHKEWHI
jgi:hypothetical protein